MIEGILNILVKKIQGISKIEGSLQATTICSHAIFVRWGSITMTLFKKAATTLEVIL